MEETDRRALAEHCEHKLAEMLVLLNGTPMITLTGLVRMAREQAELEMGGNDGNN